MKILVIGLVIGWLLKGEKRKMSKNRSVLIINVIMLLLATSSTVIAATVYWSESIFVTQEILPPVYVSMPINEITLQSIYGGETQIYTGSNSTYEFLDGFLKVEVYVSPKSLRLTLVNQSALEQYYDLFNATFTSPSVEGSLGFGDGLTSSITLHLDQKGTYIFDLTIKVTASSDITEQVTVKPVIKCEVLG